MTNDDMNESNLPDEGTTDEINENQSDTCELEIQLEAAQAEVEKLRDRYLRSAAELDNYRKRVTREREQQHQRSTIELVRPLLPVADDFELALAHVPEDYREFPWIEGLLMIYTKLETYLRSMGLNPIQATGQPFDPRYHEALTSEHSNEYPEGLVSEEVRKGYMLGDQVVRPTLVKVSRGAGQA
jgi:molecular chaperone GrpE